MYRYRYRRYFSSKVSVPISSLLLNYRVPSSAGVCQMQLAPAVNRTVNHRICNLRTVSLGHVTDQFELLKLDYHTLCFSIPVPYILDYCSLNLENNVSCLPKKFSSIPAKQLAYQLIVIQENKQSA